MKEKFIERLTELLQAENTLRGDSNEDLLDIHYMIAPIAQGVDTYSEFIKDISQNEYIISNYQHFEESSLYKYSETVYLDGQINIYIGKTEEKEFLPLDYFYQLNFVSQRIYANFCRCKGKCEGNDCDWIAPGFFIAKINIKLWQGTQKEYMEYLV